VDVDVLVQKQPGYEDQIQEINDQRLAPEALQSALQKLYFAHRGKADFVADAVLNTALLGGYHLAWETTGASLAWTLKEIDRVKRAGYTVTVAYPVVPLHLLQARAHLRGQQTGQIGAPAERIRTVAEGAARNISTLLQHVDRVLIFDNGGSKPVLLLNISIDYPGTAAVERTSGRRQQAVCECANLPAFRARWNMHRGRTPMGAESTAPLPLGTPVSIQTLKEAVMVFLQPYCNGTKTRTV
jgi:predicted ABC-type ATPase